MFAAVLLMCLWMRWHLVLTSSSSASTPTLQQVCSCERDERQSVIEIYQGHARRDPDHRVDSAVISHIHLPRHGHRPQILGFQKS